MVREAQRLIEFRVGPARAALSLPLVREVIARPAIVPVPGTHPHVAGVALSRGIAIPVYDLRRFSPLWEATGPRSGAEDGNAAAEEPTNLIVCAWGETLLGLLAGSVDLLDDAAEHAAAPGAAAMKGECVGQLLRGGGGVVTLLDPARLFPLLGVPEAGVVAGPQGGSR
jgi:chemotaxis signal transduction protein